MYESHKTPETIRDGWPKSETTLDNARRAEVMPIAEHEAILKARNQKLRERRLGAQSQVGFLGGDMGFNSSVTSPLDPFINLRWLLHFVLNLALAIVASLLET